MALGWDAVVVEGVVEAMDNASSPKEVDHIVQVTAPHMHASAAPSQTHTTVCEPG